MSSWQEHFNNVCGVGNMRIIRKLYKKRNGYMHNLNEGFSTACASDQWSVVKFLIDRGINNWNSGLISACKNGHISIV